MVTEPAYGVRLDITLFGYRFEHGLLALAKWLGLMIP